MPSRPMAGVFRTIARPRTFLTRPIRRNATSRYNPGPLPPNYPQVNYSGESMFVFRSIGKFVKYIIYVSGTACLIGLVAFEGVHTYVERGPLASSSRGNDEYGWEDEIQGWTGGVKGGTDPRLGWKGRHAVRAAWMCQNWGAGSTSVIRQGLFEPDNTAVQGMAGFDGRKTQVDRGYQLADEFLDLAIAEAQRKGLVFPPTLSVARPVGPPTTTVSQELQGDPAALDLLLLKAGTLERIATPDSLRNAKGIYEQVLGALHGNATDARVLRLTGKVGDLCARLGQGDEALSWWGWGLNRVGLEIPSGLAELKAGARSWLGSKPTPEHVHVPSPDLPPPVLRSTISLLTSSSAYLATHSHLPAAAKLQTTALTLLPAPSPIPQPTTATAGLNLHTAWLQQRSALITLHLASVTHALKKPALNLATTASARADSILDSISPFSPVYAGSLEPPAQILHRDALLTAAEAAYTQGVLLEKQSPGNLSAAQECLEKAVLLSVRESGREDEDAGPEYQKYLRSLDRVKEKISRL